MARTVPKRIFEEIRFRNDIVEVIGSYFTLQRAGTSFRALCPFHKEKTPSFNVCPKRQIFHCFGCGEGGDVFTFVMKHEGVPFMTAAKILAQRAGVALEIEESDEGAADKALLYRANAEAVELYHALLKDGTAGRRGREYLAQRDMDASIVEEFQIGYAPAAWDSIVRWAEKKKYSPELLENAGLLVRKTAPASAGGQFYDRFRDRVMFPIFDEQNRAVGFSGRALEQTEKAAKYVNSPETPLFHKGRVLYALHKARRNIVEAREALICEGQIDVIRCHQAGFNTAVAAQGTAFTEDHIRILRRYADSVCLAFDPDKAGENAAIKAAAAFVNAGFAVRVAELPKGEDPDSFIRKRGADAFRAVLNNAGSSVRYQIGVLSAREDVSSEAGLMRAARAVLETIVRSPNAVQRTKQLQEAAELLKLPEEVLGEEMRRVQSRTAPASGAWPQPGRGRGAATPETKAPPHEELALCELLAQLEDNDEAFELVRKHLPIGLLSSGMCRLLIEALFEARKAGVPLHDALRGHDDGSGQLQKFAACAQMAPSKIAGSEFSGVDALKDMILAIWRRKLKEERAAIGMGAPGAHASGSQPALRRAQLTADIKALARWEDGVNVIDIHLLENPAHGR